MSGTTNRPLVFVDLDDTLFQTPRKMADGERFAVAFDVAGQAISYMTPIQKQFVEWLLQTADVIPVTARGVETYRRVDLPFCHGAICAHGGVLLSETGELDVAWQARMQALLRDEQARLPVLADTLLQLGRDNGLTLRTWVETGAGLNLYAVVKHQQMQDSVLHTVLALAQSQRLIDGLSVHLNGNNLAFLPECLGKQAAVREWIRRDQERFGERVYLGFGDSLTDLGFLGECHWWGTPQRGQLARQIFEGLQHG